MRGQSFRHLCIEQRSLEDLTPIPQHNKLVPVVRTARNQLLHCDSWQISCLTSEIRGPPFDVWYPLCNRGGVQRQRSTGADREEWRAVIRRKLRIAHDPKPEHVIERHAARMLCSRRGRPQAGGDSRHGKESVNHKCAPVVIVSHERPPSRASRRHTVV